MLDSPEAGDEEPTAGHDRVRVLLVDDHPVILDGLQALLGHESDLDVVAVASGGEEALERASALRPDVVLLDLKIPPPAGADLIRALQVSSPESRVLILTTYDDDAHLLEAISAGAAGYLLKGSPVDDVVAGIRRVHAGDSLLTPALTGKLFARLASPESQTERAGITPRESEVLELLVTGASNQQIAETIFVSTRTVKAHLASIFEKLDVHDRTAAATEAIRRGLVRLDDAD